MHISRDKSEIPHLTIKVQQYLECIGLCEIHRCSIDEWAVDVDDLCSDVTEWQVTHNHFVAVFPVSRVTARLGYPDQLYVQGHINSKFWKSYNNITYKVWNSSVNNLQLK